MSVHDPFTVEGLREDVAQAVGKAAADVADDDNLMEHGLDSLRMMMLAARWQQHGVEIPFDRLAEIPTVAAWSVLLSPYAGRG